MAKGLAILGKIAGGLVGFALLPLGLFAFFFLGLMPLFTDSPIFQSYLAKPYGTFMVLAGGYWLWVGSRLLRGMLAVTFDPRRFIAGNLCLLAACIAWLFSVWGVSARGMAAGAGAMPLAAGALWLWTAVRLLAIDGVPAASLGRFAGGCALLVAATVLGAYGVVDRQAAGVALIAAGALLFALAFWLLRAAAPRRSVAAADEESRPPDTRWRWRPVGGFAITLLGFAAWWQGAVFFFREVLRIHGEAEAGLPPPVWEGALAGLLVPCGGVCFWLGVLFARGKKEKLSGGNWVFVGATALLYAGAAIASTF